jgi:hypothetical protein
MVILILAPGTFNEAISLNKKLAVNGLPDWTGCPLLGGVMIGSRLNKAN